MMSPKQLLELLPLEVWRGAAQAWQCDEMGHLNGSFYISNADEGFAAVAAELGIGADERSCNWRATYHHMRLMREIRAGTSLHMRGGITSVHDDTIGVLQVLVNSETDEPSAVIASGLRHQSGPGSRQLDDATKARALQCLVMVPTEAYAQAIPDRVPVPFPDLSRAREIGLRQTALGCFLPAEGRRGSDDVMTDTFIVRIADATRFLSRLFEKTARSLDPEQPRLGTAALECRLDYLGWPKVGNRFSIQSCFSEIGAGSSRRTAHWIFDADTGCPLSTVHTLEVNFDLDARRARRVDPKVRSILHDYISEQLLP